MKRDAIYIGIIVLLLAYGVTAHYHYTKLKLKHEIVVSALKSTTDVAGKVKDLWKARKSE